MCIGNLVVKIYRWATEMVTERPETRGLSAEPAFGLIIWATGGEGARRNGHGEPDGRYPQLPGCGSPPPGRGERTFYWPFEPSDDHIGNFLSVFESEGYQRCEHGKPENGHDKVVLFLNEWGTVKHVALQPGGADHWLSKLGGWYDIKHENVDAVSGSVYGWPGTYLSRPSGGIG